MRFLPYCLSWMMVVVCCGSSLGALGAPQANAGAEARIAELAQRGQQALAAGHFDQAETAMVELSKLQPGVAEIYANLGAIYFQEGKFEEAVVAIRHALKLKPTLVKLKTLLAVSLEELGRTEEALPGLEAGFHGSNEAQVKRQCGLELLRAYTALHRDSEAVAVALALNKAYPDDGEVLYQTGRIYGNFAYITMERLRDKAPDSVWMLQAAAEAQESEKQYDAAIESFQGVLRQEPQRPGVHYRMGRVYLAKYEAGHDVKDRGLAEGEFRAELALDALNGNAAYEMAQIHYEAGKLDEARGEFEALVARRPEFEQARVGLAGVLLESQKAELAVPQLKRAVELNKNDEVAWYRLGRALRMTGDAAGQKQAMAEFQRLHAVESARLARAGVLAQAGEVTPQVLGTTEP